MSRLVFVGGVDVSWHCLKKMCEMGQAPSLVFGYPQSLAHRSGFKNFSDLQKTYKFPLVETDNINDPANKAMIEQVAPDLILVIGWSQLVDSDILSMARLGCVGIHPTRLPEGRGRAPIPWTFIKGLDKSAVSLLFLEKGADAGDIIGQKEFEVSVHDDARSLYDKIQNLHVDLIGDFLPKLLNGGSPRQKQNETKAIYWPKRRPDDGRIQWDKTGWELYNWIRGLTHPYPGAFTFLQEKKLFVWKAEFIRGYQKLIVPAGTVVGEVIGTDGPQNDGLLVQAGQDGILLRKVQWDGEKEEKNARQLLLEKRVELGGHFE